MPAHRQGPSVVSRTIGDYLVVGHNRRPDLSFGTSVISLHSFKDHVTSWSTSPQSLMQDATLSRDHTMPIPQMIVACKEGVLLEYVKGARCRRV